MRAKVDFGKRERDLLLIGAAGVLALTCDCDLPGCPVETAQQTAALALAASVLREMEQRQARQGLTTTFKEIFG